MVVLLFCFFKQRTAYEMRISDWSSDVCSSDLYPVRRVLVGPDIDAGEAALRAMALQAGNGGGLPPIVEAHAVDDGAIFHQAEQARAGVAQQRQIGRASCRERVCQYV